MKPEITEPSEFTLCWICNRLRPSENTIAVALDDVFENTRICSGCMGDDLYGRIQASLAISEANVRLLKGLRQRLLASRREFYRAVVAGEVDRLRAQGCTDQGICRSFLSEFQSVEGEHREARLEWLEQSGMSMNEICDELNQPLLNCFETETEQ